MHCAGAEVVEVCLVVVFTASEENAVTDCGLGNLGACGIVNGGSVVGVVVVSLDNGAIAVSDNHDAAEVVLVVVKVLAVAAHGEEVIDIVTIDIRDCMHRVVFFYTLDATIEVEGGVCGGGFADAAVESVVLVGGGGAIVHTNHAVAVVVLICVATVAEHIAVAIVLHRLIADSGVSIHVIVGVGCGNT